MVFQQGSTSVAQNIHGDLGYEISHLSNICAQACVFTGPDAEAGALTYAGVRVLLLRAIEQQENMNRLHEAVQMLSQETRNSISACTNELSTLRTHVSTLQQNIHEVYNTLKGHGVRLDHLENITRNVGNIESLLSMFEQRIQTNANAIGNLDHQHRDLHQRIQVLCTTELVDHRVRELNDAFIQRLTMLERVVQDVQAQKADLNQVPSIVMSHVQNSLVPIESDISALYRLWDLNKSDVHNVVHASSGMGAQTRVNLLHSTPAFVALLEMLRAPQLPTVTVGPASVGGSSNINVTSTSPTNSFGQSLLSPRSAAAIQQYPNGSNFGHTGVSPRSAALIAPQPSFLGIEVGPGSDSTGGVVVTRVLPGTPASAAGLRVGDVLVAMNDYSFNSISELVNVTRQCLSAKPANGCYVAVTRVTISGREKVNLWIP